MKYSQHSWGPKPFRVINVWFQEYGFKQWVESEYSKLTVQGWGAFVLKEKLKQLKVKLKEWHVQYNGALIMVVNGAVNKIGELDDRDDLGSLSLTEAQLQEEEIKKF